jgi:DNA-binding transcriptional regulator YiaG
MTFRGYDMRSYANDAQPGEAQIGALPATQGAHDMIPTSTMTIFFAALALVHCGAEPMAEDNIPAPPVGEAEAEVGACDPVHVQPMPEISTRARGPLRGAEQRHTRCHASQTMNLAQLVRALRGAFHESQPAFARRIGIGQSAVARLETGPHVPTLATLQRLADATGATLTITLRPGGGASGAYDMNVIAETRENGPIGETMTRMS